MVFFQQQTRQEDENLQKQLKNTKTSIDQELLNMKPNLSIGQVVYLAKNIECIITDLVDNTIHTKIKHEVKAVSDAKTKNAVQIRFENRQFKIDEIGTKLFFKIDDYLLKRNEIQNDSDYRPYLTIISDQLLSQDEEKIKHIKKYEPDNPMSEQQKQQIIHSYSNIDEQTAAEAVFRNTNKNGDYFGRLDIDTCFHDADNWFDGHYYTKIYISETPIGQTKFLNRDTVVWQLNAGLYQEKQGSTIGDGAFKVQASRNSYVDSGIVVSWKSPVADLYYNNEKTNLKIAGRFVYDHDLILKRRFSNYEGAFNNLFVSGDNIYEEGAVDQFLINVLNENKSKHELCDIIRTIQSNQNLIIRRPLHENLVVQGCAGSGKTMIMLHRLSYLLYNNPALDMSTIKVLTPNELFNLHINELSKTLELNNIERLTIEKYYAQLLSRFHSDWVPVNDFRSEAIVDQSYVNYIYTDQFKSDIHSEYLKWLNHLSESINEDELKMISSKYELTVSLPDTRLRPTDISRYRNIVNRMHTQLQEILKIDKSILHNKQKIKELSSALISQVNELESKLNAKDKALNEKLAALESQLKVVNDKLVKSESEADTSELRLFREDRQRLLEKNINDISSQMYGNKQAIKNFTELYVEVISLSTKLETLLDSLYKVVFASDISNNLKELTDDINIVVDRIDWLAAKVSETTNKQTEGITREIKKHAQNMKKLIPSSDMMQKIKNVHGKIMTIRDEDINCVAFAQKRLNEITVNYIFDEIMANIIKHRFPAQKLDLKGTYRFRLYAQLLFSVLYFGASAKGDQMLLIDEGQDLAVNEYRLLNDINGGNVIFNVFGDTNQLIKLGRGIQDWNALKSAFDINLFSINENYRNTNEITVFCNEQFDLNTLPVGLSGQEVRFMPTEQMIASLKNRKDADLRVAIVLKQKEGNAVLEQLMESKIPFKSGEIEPGVVTLIDVEKAKGLEFDIVYAFPESMSKNEQYIAFTRALSELIVVG